MAKVTISEVSSKLEALIEAINTNNANVQAQIAELSSRINKKAGKGEVEEQLEKANEARKEAIEANKRAKEAEKRAKEAEKKPPVTEDVYKTESLIYELGKAGLHKDKDWWVYTNGKGKTSVFVTLHHSQPLTGIVEALGFSTTTGFGGDSNPAITVFKRTTNDLNIDTLQAGKGKKH